MVSCIVHENLLCGKSADYNLAFTPTWSSSQQDRNIQIELVMRWQQLKVNTMEDKKKKFLNNASTNIDCFQQQMFLHTCFYESETFLVIALCYKYDLNIAWLRVLCWYFLLMLHGHDIVIFILGWCRWCHRSHEVFKRRKKNNQGRHNEATIFR